MDTRTKILIAAATKSVEGSLQMVTFLVGERDRIADKWLFEADRHEMAAREIDEEEKEDRDLHLEVARTLRGCAQDLLHPVTETAETQDEIRF